MANERAALASLVAPQHTAVLVVDVQPLFTAMPLSPPLAEVLPRLRRFLDRCRWLFETVEHAPSRWLSLEQSIQEPTFLFGEAPDDQLEKASMDQRPHSTNQTVQRAEGGQFEALAHQFLDGDVDQISRVVLYLGRFVHRRRGDMKCVRSPRAHIKELANGCVMALERANADAAPTTESRFTARGDDGMSQTRVTGDADMRAHRTQGVLTLGRA